MLDFSSWRAYATKYSEQKDVFPVIYASPQ